jgi:hypothetical protein
MIPGLTAEQTRRILADVIETQRNRVERWQRLCAKYKGAYEPAPKRAASA